MISNYTTEDLLEVAIEFALKVKENTKISRAEYRHDILKQINEFVEHNNLNENDIDEQIAKYLY